MNVSSFFNYEDPLQNEESPEATLPADHSLLANWPSESWNHFLELTQTLRFDTGEVVFQLGDTDRALYLVSAGQFEILLPRSSGALRIATADLGSVIGDQCFLDSQPQPFTAQALTEGELVRFSYASYESLSARHPELANQLIWDLARLGSLRQRQIASRLAE